MLSALKRLGSYAEGFQSRIVVPDPQVSNVHLRFYTISSENINVPALVYVQDLSTNGTVIKRTRDDADLGHGTRPLRLRRRDPALLINHGDQMCFGSSCYFEYLAWNDRWVSRRSSDQIRIAESKVGLSKIF